MSKPARIQRGMSPYSYQEEFFLRKPDLDHGRAPVILYRRAPVRCAKAFT